MAILTRSQRQALNDQANPEHKPNSSTSAFAPAPSETVPEPPARLPHENIREYVHSAEVPKAKFRRNHPPICRGADRVAPPSQYLLSIEPDSRLRLKEVWVSRGNNMAGRVKSLIRALPFSPIPDADTRGTYIRTANFNVPAPGFLTFIEPPTQVDDAMSLAQNTMRVLETAERVINLVWPEESRGLAFTFATDSSAVEKADASICVPLHYAKIRESDLVSITEPKVKMVVLVLPPWAIAMADMHEMLTMGKFPPFENADGIKPTYTRAQKIWAQIYNCCSSQNCPYFALTTSEHWIFGTFQTASGWSRVISTAIMSYTDTQPEPNILEWIIFWCVSALKLPGGWSPTQSTISGNPEIAQPDRLQLSYSQANANMRSQHWLNTYLDNNAQGGTNQFTTTQLAEHPNIFITRFS